MDENGASEAHMMNLIKKIQSQMNPSYENEDSDQIKQLGLDKNNKKPQGTVPSHRGSLLVLQNSLNHTQNQQF